MTTTDVFLMIRCPQCGEVMLHRHVSLFVLHGREKVSFCCSCGFLACTMAPQGKRHYQVDIWSLCCQQPHRFIFTQGQLLKSSFALRCERTDTHLGYLGNRESVVAEILDNDVLSLEDGFSLWDFFADIDCMVAVLEKFYQLLAAGKVQCHHCGNDVDVKIYRDRIELRCPHCNYGGFFMAEKQIDKIRMQQAEGLILEKEGITVIYGNTVSK